MSSDPSKMSGHYQSTMGTTKEGLGKVVGSENLKSSGQQQQLAGQAELEAARAQGYKEGTQDRIGGMKDSTLGAVTGDKQQQTQGNLRRDAGSTQQDMNSTS